LIQIRLISTPWLRPCSLDRHLHGKSLAFLHLLILSRSQRLIFCIPAALLTPIVSFLPKLVSLSCLTSFATVLDDAYSNTSSYNFPHPDFYGPDCWRSIQRSTTQSLEMPAIPTDGLYKISPAPSPPGLDFSNSPSPTPSQHDLVRTPEANVISRPPSADNWAPHSLYPSDNSSLSPLSRFSPLFFSEPASTGHTQKQPTWDVDSLLFENSLVPRFR
jgi:hypothetical protein